MKAFLAAAVAATLFSVVVLVATPRNVGALTLTRPLSQGMQSDDVQALQQYLKDHGYLVGWKATGLYGQATADAVAQFQTDNGLEPVGSVGPKTRALLNGNASAASAPPTSAQGTTATRSDLINSLLAQVNALQAKLAELIAARNRQTAGSATQTNSSVSSTCTPLVLPRVLDIGAKGADVSALQQLLKTLGFYSYPEITGFFGPSTQAAVAAYQSANGIEPVGRVGPKTLALLSAQPGHACSAATAPLDLTASSPAPTAPNTRTTATTTPGNPPASPSIPRPYAPGNGYTPGFGGGGGDITAPTISSHSSVTAEATSGSGAAVTYSVPSATDNVDTSVSVSCSPSSGSAFAVGTTVVTCSATDLVGNSSNSTFNVVVQDTTAPSISSISSDTLTDISATITWTTNENSNSKVVYGLTSAYGSASSSASLVTSHPVTLTGLTASTAYHYAVVSTDSSGNAATSSDQTFTTYDTASQTLFVALTTPPTTAFKSAADALILALKSASIWDDLDFLYLLPAGTAQAAYLNWKNPGTFTITPVYTDRPIFVPYRGISSNGTNSNFRTGFTPSVNSVHGTLNNASLWTWVASSTPDRLAVQEVGSTGTAASISITVRNASDNSRIQVNDLNNGTASVTTTDGSGFTGVQRLSSATKRLWKGNAQFGADIARASIAVADSEIYINGASASSFNTRQLQMAAYGANLVGKEAAFNSALNTFMQAVVPASGGRFWTTGDSYMHGSGGTTNVTMAGLLNYTTGRLITDVSAGGTTLAQQRDAILARTDLYGLPLVWWDGSANGHVDAATDLAIVDQVLAVIPASQIILITSVVPGPPIPGVTDVLLSDMQTFRAGLVARGIHTIDMQSILVALNNTGSDAASTAAGLVGPSLTQDGTHLTAAVMDTAVAQIVPLLNGI